MINENEEKALRNMMDSINKQCNAGFEFKRDYSKNGRIAGVESNIGISLSSNNYTVLNNFLNGVNQTIGVNDNLLVNRGENIDQLSPALQCYKSLREDDKYNLTHYQIFDAIEALCGKDYFSDQKLDDIQNVVYETWLSADAGEFSIHEIANGISYAVRENDITIDELKEMSYHDILSCICGNDMEFSDFSNKGLKQLETTKGELEKEKLTRSLNREEEKRGDLR